MDRRKRNSNVKWIAVASRVYTKKKKTHSLCTDLCDDENTHAHTAHTARTQTQQTARSYLSVSQERRKMFIAQCARTQSSPANFTHSQTTKCTEKTTHTSSHPYYMRSIFLQLLCELITIFFLWLLLLLLYCFLNEILFIHFTWIGQIRWFAISALSRP